MESLRELLTSLSYWGPLGGLLAGFLDAAFLPLVNLVDLVVVARGAAGDPQAWWFAAATTFGSVLGSVGLFSLSSQGRRILGLRQISEDRTAKLLRGMERYPSLILFTAAVVPAPFPMKALVVAAAVLKIDAWRFGIAILSGRAIRYFGLTWLGRRYGEAILFVVHEYRWLLLGLIALVLLILAWRLTAARIRPTPSREG